MLAQQREFFPQLVFHLDAVQVRRNRQTLDHIFAKEGWRQKVGTFAEVTYPSLDAASLALMVQNKDNEG